MRNIKKSFIQSTISSARIKLVKGKPEIEVLEPIILYGDISEKEALKALKSRYGSSYFQLTGIEKKRLVFEITVENFIKNATLIHKDEMKKQMEEK